MLEPWALDHHRWRKKLAWHSFQRRILQHAALLHATADAEADQLRQLGLQSPIAVVPNGVPTPDIQKQASSDGSTRQALFLSRIHPKKGLLKLVDAWAEVRPADWRLVIAGPDEDGHRLIVEKRVEQHGIGDVVSFPGSIPDDEKWEWYRDSDLFVLPSYSENFGVVVAEALTSGIPAITTKGTPWQDLHAHDCGWWIDLSVDALAATLDEATSLPSDQRRAMGQRGRNLVEAKYSWKHVAEQMIQAYTWILTGGFPPDCIRTV